MEFFDVLVRITSGMVLTAIKGVGILLIFFLIIVPVVEMWDRHHNPYAEKERREAQKTKKVERARLHAEYLRDTEWTRRKDNMGAGGGGSQ